MIVSCIYLHGGGLFRSLKNLFLRGLITLKTYSEIKIAVVGGDLRQLSCAKEFSALGFKTVLYGFDNYHGKIEHSELVDDADIAISDSDIIILPLPFSSDGRLVNCPFGSRAVSFENIIKKMRSDQLILGGRFEEKDIDLASQIGIKCIDYFAREELNVANAVPTAEGAIAIAMNELPITVHASNALVLGFGRIGKILSRDLKSLGADVTVIARKSEDLAWISALDMKARSFRDLKHVSKDADVIFNTVPHTVLDEEIIANLKAETLIIDLASKPGGVDMKSARAHSIKVIWALSLPGKVAPFTAGKIIEKSILNILIEEGVISPI